MDAPYEVVRFSGEETLRDFVARYLNDPDLWPTVLRLNALASPADVVPGVVLNLPVRQVALADDALVSSLVAIQKATTEGARLFAPEQIGSAIDDRDTAIARRTTGAWREVVNYATSATKHAQEAYDISIELRDRAAEALISDIHGTVEGRDPAEPSWSDRGLNDILVEFERLRTLSNSTTQVTFRDLSRLRLNPNSNATIQRMRSDPLTGREVTKVSLSNGDFYALLNQLSDRDAFEIDVPGIKTRTDSDDFWIKNDDSGARFVNYDKASLNIDAGTQSVNLAKNEGVVISRGKAQRADVLDSPVLTLPSGGAEVYGDVVDIQWQAYPDAAGYWFEVAADPGFNRMFATEWGVTGTGYRVTDLVPGAHFWRVAALDKLGLPGKWSEVRSFDLLFDDTPPFLTLFAPTSGLVVDRDSIEVLGASEKGTRVMLNGTEVTLGADGSFFTTVALVPGENAIVVAAEDAAGNQSEKRGTVVYRPQSQVVITPDEGLARAGDVYVSRTDVLPFVAATNAKAGAPVQLRDAAGAIVGQAETGADGRVEMAIPAAKDIRTFGIEILSPTGSVEGMVQVAVVMDDVAPVIALDQPPPRATAGDVVTLSGSVAEAVRLVVRGQDVPLDDGKFATRITLAPGLNEVALRGVDAAGNVGILTVQTYQDLDPPEIVSAEVARPHGAGGPIEITVTAQDATGLRQAAPYVVEIGAQEREGFLRCDNATGLCRATLPAESGDLALVEVVVGDYAGNEAIR